MSPGFAEILAAEVAAVPRLHARVEAFGEEHAVPFAVINAVNVALDEVLTNIINHGVRQRADGACTIEVRVSLLDDDAGPRGLRVEVEDDTRAFDLLDADEPNTLVPVPERTVGGLGIFLVKRMMDRLAYEHRDGRNRLVMEKRAPASGT